MATLEFNRILNSISDAEKAKLIFSCASPVGFRNHELLCIPDFETEKYALFVIVGEDATECKKQRSWIKAPTTLHEKLTDSILSRGTNASFIIAKKEPVTYSADRFLTYPSSTIKVENGTSISVNFDIELTVVFRLKPSKIVAAIKAYHDSVFSSAYDLFITQLKETVKAIAYKLFESYQNDIDQIRNRDALISVIDKIEKSSNQIQEQIKKSIVKNNNFDFFIAESITVNILCREKAVITEASNIIPEIDSKHEIELARIQNQNDERELAQIRQIQSETRAHDATLQMQEKEHKQSLQQKKNEHDVRLLMSEEDFEQRIRHERIEFIEYAKREIITISLNSYDEYAKQASIAIEKTIVLLQEIIAANHGVKIDFSEVVPQIRSIFSRELPSRQEFEEKLNMISTQVENYRSLPNGERKHSD